MIQRPEDVRGEPSDPRGDEEEELRHLRELLHWTQVMVAASLHDLRGAVSQVRMAAHQLEDGATTDPREPIGYIRSAADGMAEKVAQLADVASGLHRDVLLSPRAMDVSTIVRDVAAAVHMDGRQLHLQVQPAHAEVDARRLRQILENLLRNTVDHTPAGTTVWVSVRPTPGGVLIEVSDDGPGIEDTEKSALLDPFAADLDPTGSGTGLSVVAMFTRIHGGQITLRDRPGGGLTVELFIPAEADATSLLRTPD